MHDFDSEDCFRRYLALVRSQPVLLTQPPGPVYEILLEPKEIQAAQAEARQYRLRHGMPAEDVRVGVLATDPYITSVRDAVRFPDGSRGLYNRQLAPDGVVVLPLLGDTIILIRCFRHATRQFHLEAPAGIATSGRATEMDARRELSEEIGAVADELIDLGDLYTNPSAIAARMRLYVARISAFGSHQGPEAIAGSERVPIERVSRSIADGAINDGPTIAVFFRARLRGLV
jgi:ADP-ribose pyrophosphatase